MKRSTVFDPPPPEERKKASVTAFKKFYRIHSWAVYRACLSDPDGVDADYPADLNDEELGAAVRVALHASRFIPPDHPDWDRVRAFWNLDEDRILLERLKKRAGVKTHAALYDGVGDVSLSLADGIITFCPLLYKGRGGFGPIRGVEPTELPETISAEELGATIRHLVDVSRRPWRY